MRRGREPSVGGMTLLNAAVVVAIVIAVVMRRLSWSELENSDTDVWRGPLVMVGVGVYQMYDKLQHGQLGTIDVVLLVIGVGLALVAGLATGRVSQVQRRQGKVFYRLGVPGLGIMAGYLVLRLGLAGLGHLLGATVTSGGGSILLTMGATLLVQSLVLQAKAHAETEEYANR
jgi:hypothetical protein